MFKIFHKFSARLRRKNFSTTLTSASEGADVEYALIPPLHNVIRKLLLDKVRTDGKDEGVSAEELNIILKHAFKKKEYKTNHFKVNKDTIDSCVFTISNVNIIFDENKKNIVDMAITFKEILNNVDVSITVSVFDIEEFMQGFTIKPVNLSIRKNKQK